MRINVSQLRIDDDLWVREMATILRLPQPLTAEDYALLDDLLWEARRRGREAARRAEEAQKSEGCEG